MRCIGRELGHHTSAIARPRRPRSQLATCADRRRRHPAACRDRCPAIAIDGRTDARKYRSASSESARIAMQSNSSDAAHARKRRAWAPWAHGASRLSMLHFEVTSGGAGSRVDTADKVDQGLLRQVLEARKPVACTRPGPVVAIGNCNEVCGWGGAVETHACHAICAPVINAASSCDTHPDQRRRLRRGREGPLGTEQGCSWPLPAGGQA